MFGEHLFPSYRQYLNNLVCQKMSVLTLTVTSRHIFENDDW